MNFFGNNIALDFAVQWYNFGLPSAILENKKLINRLLLAPIIFCLSVIGSKISLYIYSCSVAYFFIKFNVNNEKIANWVV